MPNSINQLRLAAVVLISGCMSNAYSQEPPALTPRAPDSSPRDEIASPDVFAQVRLLRDELELIRYVMGRPRNSQPEIAVQGAVPREVYFQALTMLRKADRLSFEHTRERAREPELPPGDIRSRDVLQVVQAALQRVRLVKKKLRITEESSPTPRDDRRTSTDVFRSCVQCSRQLNLLLERRFASSDVYLQVTRGVSYASRLLQQWPDSSPLPDAPKHEPGKQPRDVYLRLVGCFHQIRRIAGLSGLKILELDPEEAKEAAENAEPSDVYDIASLLVSELAFLHAHLKQTQPPRQVYFSGRRFPSHVYRRAGMLELQLIELETLVTRNPDWLRQGTEKSRHD